MGCTQSKRTGYILDQRDITHCEVSQAESTREALRFVEALRENRILHPNSCREYMVWDLRLDCHAVFITPPPDLVRQRCLLVVSRTHIVATEPAGSRGCCNVFEPQFGHILLITQIRCPTVQSMEVDMSVLPRTDWTGEPRPRLASKMTLQRPDMTAVVTALRVSLAHAYYGTPSYLIPFKMFLPKGLEAPLPSFSPHIHQAGGLRSVFLASWSLDRRAHKAHAAHNARATQECIKRFQFTPGRARYGTIDVGYLAQGDPSCILALMRALRFNTFFTHVDLSSANEPALSARTDGVVRLSSNVPGAPLATALQALLGWNVALQSFIAPRLPRRKGGSTSLNWAAIGEALLLNPRPMITAWDLTDCGLGDAGLNALLPAWWRIFTFISPVRELRLSGNALGAGSLASFFNMMNGTGYSFSPPNGFQLPPGPLPAPKTSLLTCIGLGGCDLTGAFPSLALLLSRCPFLRMLDLSNPRERSAPSLPDVMALRDSLVNSLCPLEELDMRGNWSWGRHVSVDSAAAVSSLLVSKPALRRLSFGGVVFSGTRQRQLDPFIVAAAISTSGTAANAPVDRRNQTVDMSFSQLEAWLPAGPTAPASLILRMCGISARWYQGLLSFCTSPLSTLRRLDIGLSFSWLDEGPKLMLASLLGQLITTAPLEALIMPGDPASRGANTLSFAMLSVLAALGQTKTLQELDVSGHGMGDAGAVALGNALRQNRSIATLSYDHNTVTLEGFKAIRGCLYGNKKLVNVSAPEADLKARIAFLANEVALGKQRMWEIKRRIKIAYHRDRREFRQEIENISANNKAWKALERELKKTVDVVATIAACVTSNRELKQLKDVDKQADKMERQKEAFEERNVTKMGRILSSLSKKTDKARVQSAFAKTSHFQARPRTFFYQKDARELQQREPETDHHNRRRNDPFHGMYFIPYQPPYQHPHYFGGGDSKRGEDDDRATHGNEDGTGSASVAPEEELVNVQDDYAVDPAMMPDYGDATNPLDGVRDLIVQEGPRLFDANKLERVHDMLREAGADVYEAIRPLLSQAGDFTEQVADKAASWGTDVGSVVDDISASYSSSFEGLSGFFSDIGDALGGAVEAVGDAVENAVDNVGEAASALAGGAADLAGDLAEGVGDAAADAADAVAGVAEDAIDAAGDALDGARDVIPDVADRDLDDVDMYAGAGPMDLDDGGPSSGGPAPKVMSGSLVGGLSQRHYENNRNDCGDEQMLIGVGEWTASRVRARETRRWEEILMAHALETAVLKAVPYKTKLHAFRAGRALPSPDTRVTLVSQCSIDRLPSVLKQALRWCGDMSLAVYVPSAPAGSRRESLRQVKQLCHAIDEARSVDPLQQNLSLDVALLEGVEVDYSKHDHCGPLYPVNALRNLALLQARDDTFHPAPTVFLVDSDCVPSTNLLDELSRPDVQRRACRSRDEDADDVAVAEESTTAIVVPCLEFSPGTVPDGQVGLDPPSSVGDAVSMLRDGRAQGFHVDYFYKGHGPTDFDRWASAASKDSHEGLAHDIDYSSCFEPYVVVDKLAVPMCDERFRGYGMNKVAHLLSLASGSPATGATKPIPPAKFVVLRKAFVFAVPHERSGSWQTTFGKDGDLLRRCQIKALWRAFEREVSDGIPPVVSSSTASRAEALSQSQSPPPRYRVHEVECFGLPVQDVPASQIAVAKMPTSDRQETKEVKTTAPVHSALVPFHCTPPSASKGRTISAADIGSGRIGFSCSLTVVRPINRGDNSTLGAGHDVNARS